MSSSDLVVTEEDLIEAKAIAATLTLEAVREVSSHFMKSMITGID